MPDFKLKSYTVSIMASALTILLQYLQSAEAIHTCSLVHSDHLFEQDSRLFRTNVCP